MPFRSLYNIWMVFISLAILIMILIIWFDSIKHISSKHRLRWYLTAQAFDCTFVIRPGILHSDADAESRGLTHNL